MRQLSLMSIDEAKRKIFARLCRELDEPGSDGWMPIHDFHEEAGIPYELFQKALAEMRVSTNPERAIEISSSTKELRLGANARGACRQGRNPF